MGDDSNATSELPQIALSDTVTGNGACLLDPVERREAVVSPWMSTPAANTSNSGQAPAP